MNTKDTISLEQALKPQLRTEPFTMNYAAHLGNMSPDEGMFRHHAGPDPVDQIRFAGERGFAGIEDNWMKWRETSVQQAIGRELERSGLKMGVMVNTAVYDRPTFVLNDMEERERLMEEVRETSMAAKRVGARFVTTLSGTAHPSLPAAYQTANMIENLKWAGDVAEQEGIVLAIEPINHKGWPGTFVTDIGHAYMIARSVGMPSVKILYDFWHQQIHGGDLLENLDLAWDEIAYVQIADNPGRSEPGTGEINYASIMRRLHERGYGGLIGLEFDPVGEGISGERAVLEALRAIDPGSD